MSTNSPIVASAALHVAGFKVALLVLGFVRNKAVYIALAILPDGTKEILGLWIEQTEGAKFWLRVMNEIKNRGVQDILLAVVDGLKGFPEAINATFPETVVQTCMLVSVVSPTLSSTVILPITVPVRASASLVTSGSASL